MKKQLIAGLASLMMVVPTVGNIQAKSSSAKLMDQFVAAYRKGDYQKAKAVTNKMSATVEEPCAYKMSKAMKKAYKAKVKSYIKRYGADWSFDVPVSKTNQVKGFSLSDLDSDGKAELIIIRKDIYESGTTSYNVFTFKKNKAVRIGKNIKMGIDGYLHAYPGKKGVYFFAQDHSILDLEKGVIKKGKFKWQRIKSPVQGGTATYENFMSNLVLKMSLPDHFDNGNNRVDLSLFN